MSTTNGIARLSTGTIVLSDQYESDRVRFLSRDGEPLRTAGRRGAGPGEYTDIVDLEVDRSDRVHVFDYDGRWTILDSLGTVLETRPLPRAVYQAGVAMLPDGGLVINRRDPHPERFGYWLFMTDSTGMVEAPMGDRFSDVPLSAAVSPVALRHVLPIDDRIWVVHVYDYRIELYDASGEQLRTITRDADWFPEYDYDRWAEYVRNGTEIFTDDGHRPYISGAMIDDGGRLWVAITLGRPGWREAIEAGRVSDAFETVVEVWDLSRPRVLASCRFPFYTRGFADSRELITVVEMPYRTELRLRRVRLRRSDRGASRRIGSSRSRGSLRYPSM
ncbi:MAG: hypothetical protein ACOC8B_08095 [Gemmatimonadota bacterium]